MKAIPIKNHQIISRLDLIGEDMYKLPHKWKHHPLPKTDIETLRNYMDNPNFSGHPEVSNNIDYSGRGVSVDFRDRTAALIGAIKELTGSSHWYWDSMIFQPPATGWTGWHNGGDKPHKFISFIHNSGTGFTNFIKNGKRIKIEDRHIPTHTKDWTCLVGELNGVDTWKSDRNMGNKPRIVLTLGIKGKYGQAFSTLEDFIKNA